jgi:hypothetical protein
MIRSDLPTGKLVGLSPHYVTKIFWNDTRENLHIKNEVREKGGNYMTNLSCRQTKQMRRQDVIMAIGVVALIAIMVLMVTNVTFAETAEYVTDIQNTLKQMINVVCTIFQAVGVILSVYAVGQLILAFKNEDADSKSRASTMLVVGIVLIAMPTLIQNLNLINNLTGGKL